ncbi:Ankrd44 [Symbiodinium sp. KB8]|nr:Ankrd44 [Symbiodinium sp. KB8]
MRHVNAGGIPLRIQAQRAWQDLEDSVGLHGCRGAMAIAFLADHNVTELPNTANAARNCAIFYMKLGEKLSMAAGEWLTYVVPAASIAVAILAVAVEAKWAQSGQHLPLPTDEDGDFLKGARLQVAKARTEGKVLKLAFRALEVVVNGCFFGGMAMIVVWWPFWLAILSAVYVLPAACQYGLLQVVQVPALAIATPENRSWLSLLRSFLLVGLAFKVTATRYRNESGLARQLASDGFQAVQHKLPKLTKVQWEPQHCLDMDALKRKVWIMALDVLFDMNTILSLLVSRNFQFAACLTFVVARSTAKQLSNLKSFKQAIGESARRGLLHAVLLDIFEEEKGAEAFFSLMITSYSYVFCVQSATQAFLQCFSIFLSICGLAAFLVEHLDLDYEPEEQAETDPRPVMRGSGPELQSDCTEVPQHSLSCCASTCQPAIRPLLAISPRSMRTNERGVTGFSRQDGL